MSTRVKIFLSYLIMGILPIFLFASITFFAVYRSIESNPFLMSINDNEENLFKSVNYLSRLEILAEENPDGLFDKALLSGIDKVISQCHIGVMLVDGDKEQFYVSRILEQNDLAHKIATAQIKQFRENKEFDGDHFLFPDYQRLYTNSNFFVMGRNLQNNHGTLYIAIESWSSKNGSDTVLKRFSVFLLVGMVGVIVFMTLLVTKSMMQSLRTLKNGVNHIAQGDLDFSIRTNKRDEVAQVIMSFEEMRLRLKSSIYAQIKEDENRREFVANISHDLRTPVTAIKGYVEGLIDGTANTPEKVEKYTKTILSKTVALDRMIDDLFLYSSLDVGKANYHFETVSASNFFGSLYNEIMLDLEGKGFEVKCILEIPPDTMVKLDRSMIQRLQHNLTENAVKYCRESDRKVVFSAGVKEDRIICSTEDNGKGIQSDALPHIFERFYRADAARTSTTGGTGLGLQISKRIVEDHGGMICAESSYGEFTRISWTLPVLSNVDGGYTQNA